MKCILEKNSSISEGTIGDIITFKLEVKNNSSLDFYNVIIKDILPAELKFVLGSITIDYKKDTYSNILSGVNIGDLGAGKNKIITFDVEVKKSSKNTIFSEAVVEYTFKSNENLKSGYAYSNICEIIAKNPSIIINKECNKSEILLDDTMKFNIYITNNGDLDILNLVLLEDIPNNLTIIDGSFSIDNCYINSVELEKGICIEGLKKGQTKTISYSTKVITSNSNRIIDIDSRIKYAYVLQNGLINYKESESIRCTLKMAISSFKQVNIDDHITINNDKPDIYEINDLKATVRITSQKVIKTSVAKSSEGKLLSGYKLIVHGVLNQILEYVACDKIQSVHTDSLSIPFSSYIVLPQDFNITNKVNIESIIENIYYNEVDSRSLFESINILLIAKSSN